MLRIYILLLLVVTSQQYEAQHPRKTLDFSANNLNARVSNGLPVLPPLGNNHKREVFWYEQTLAFCDSDNNNVTKLVQCEVLEIYQLEQMLEVLHNLLKNSTIQAVNMEKMMMIMNECDALDNLGLNELEHDEEAVLENLKKAGLSDTALTKLKTNQKGFSVSILKAKMSSMIFPDTKWCGPGDVAKGYHDLGKYRNTDRCCRAHDLCPVSIASMDKRYNLHNGALCTRSDCLCDQAFYSCLKNVHGCASNIVGSLYFGAVSPQCIQGLPDIPDPKMKFVPNQLSWFN